MNRRRPPPEDRADDAGATYAYCVVQAAAVDLADAPPGPPEASPPRALALAADLAGQGAGEAASGLWLIVAGVPLRLYTADVLERRLGDLEWVSDCALAHEAVVEHFAAAAAGVVPLPLFTLFADDLRAQRRLVAQRPRLERALARVAGGAEWGLKVFLEPAPPSPPAGPIASGTQFLERKLQARTAARDLGERARAAAEELFRSLSEAAVASVRKPAPVPGTGTRLLFEAAFLVRRDATPAFEERVAAASRALAEAGCAVTLTGPWPPYHFVGDALTGTDGEEPEDRR